MTVAYSGLTPSSGTWNTNNGNWDVITTANFNVSGDTADTFYNGDSVVFTNTGTVTLPANVFPASVNVGNTIGTVQFNGPGAITGPGALTKNGAGGLLVITNSNNYGGGTFINGGTVQVNNATLLSTPLGVGPINIAAGGQLLTGSNWTVIGNAITLSGTSPNGAISSTNRGGSGLITTFTGPIQLNATSNITSYWFDQPMEFTGKITGPGGLILSFNNAGGNGGTYFLTNANNDYAGPTTVTGGSGGGATGFANARLYLGANNALPTTTSLTLNSADVYLNGYNQTLPAIISGTGSQNIFNSTAVPSTITLGTTNLSFSFTGNINDGGNILPTNYSNTQNLPSGFVSVVKVGTGNMTLGGASSFSGGLAINGGTVTIFNSNNLGSTTNYSGSAGAVTFNGGVLAMTNTAGFTTSRNFYVNSSGGTFAIYGNHTINGVVGGPGSLYVTSPTTGRTLTLGNSTNSFPSSTVVNTVLQVATDPMLGPVPVTPTTNITLINGGLYNNGGSLSISANRNIAVSGMGYFQAGWGPAITTINGNIANISGGSGGVGIMWDAGPLVLTGVNTYTGPTVIGTVGPGSSYWNSNQANVILRLGSAGAQPDTYVNFGVHPQQAANTATFDLYNQSPSVLGLTGGGNAIVDNSGGGSSTLTINGSGGVFSGLVRSSSGSLALVVNISGIQNFGGTGTYSGGTTLSNGTLQLGSATALPAAGSFTANAGVLDLNGNNGAVGQFSGAAGRITSGVAGAPVLTVNNTSPSIFSGTFVNGAAGLGRPGLTLASSELTLTGLNSSDGPVSVNGGATLNVANGATIGGSIGGNLTLGSGTAAGTLVLGDGSGPAGTVRVSRINTAGSVGGSIVGNNAANSNLVINYSNTAVQNTINATIGGPGANQNNIAVNLTGVGQVSLPGVHTYSGPTTVSAGTLNLTGQLVNSSVTIANGAALTGVGNNSTTAIIGGSANANAGSTIYMPAGLNSTSLTINGGLTLGGSSTVYSSGRASLVYKPASGIEAINLGPAGSPTGGLTINPGGAYVGLLAGYYPVPGATYNLINYASLTQAGANGFSLDPGTPNVTNLTVGGGRLNYTLLQSASALQLSVTGVAYPQVAYYVPLVGTGAWSDLSDSTYVNWSTASESDPGSDFTFANVAPMIPGATTDVILAATIDGGAIGDTTANLGGPVVINSLNSNINNQGYTIAADGFTLTIQALADSNTASDSSYAGNPAGLGISLSTDSGPLTINAPVILGNGQSWINASGSALTVNGPIVGSAAFGSTQTLTLSNAGSGATMIGGSIGDGAIGGALAVSVSNAGSGLTTLGAPNTYTGGTKLWAGSLLLASSGATGTGPLTIVSGQVDVGGNSFSWPALNGAGTITNSGTATSTLTIQSGSYSGSITDDGAIAVVKSGSDTLALTGSNNYSGGTALNAGLLQVNTTASLGAQTGNLTFGGGTLQLLASLASGRNFLETSNQRAYIDTNGFSLDLSGSIGPATGAVNTSLWKLGAGTLGLSANDQVSGSATVDAGVLNLTGTLTTGTGTYVARSNSSAASAAVSGVLSTANLFLGNGTSAVGSVNNSGSITTPGNVYAGFDLGSNGSLVNSGTIVATGNLYLGNGTSSIGVLRTSGNITANTLYLGFTSGAVGAAYQTAGNVVLTPTANPTLFVGWNNGGYGYYNFSGGNLATQELQVGAWGPGQNSGGNGLFEMSAGTLNDPGWITMNRSGGTAAYSQVGVLSLTGGLINFAGGGLVGNWSAGGQTMVVNVSGGTLATTNNTAINLNTNGSAANTGILNLSGGLVIANNVTTGNGGPGIVNFNGGTLRASGGNGDFLNVGGGSGAVYVYSGGAKIDDGNNAITINQPLLAASGNGVTNGGLTASGVGYVSPPIVTVSDATGSGATALASIDANGNLTGITITSAGVNYSNPTFTLIGGGGTGSVTGSATLVANATTGALTKNGSGTTTLTAANTYGGPTTVNAGTLLATQLASLPNYSVPGDVSVAAGAYVAVQSGAGGDWASTDDDTLLNRASFASGSGFGISVPAGTSFTYGTDIATGQVNKNFRKLGGGLLVLNGVNSYTGTTSVTGGTLQFGDGTVSSVPAAGAAYVNNGTMAFIQPAASPDLTINVPMTTTGASNLYWPGQGKLTLGNSNNTFGGGATIANGGTIQLAADNALTAAAVTLNNATVFDTQGHSNSLAALTLNGNSSVIQTGGVITVTSGADGQPAIGNAAGSNATYTMSGGALNVPNGNMNVSAIGGGGSGTFIQTGGTVTVNPWYIIARFGTNGGGGTGILNISGGLTQQINAANGMNIGEGGTGVVTVSGSGQLKIGGTQGIHLGYGANTGNGTLNLLTGGTVTTSAIAGGGNGSTLNLDGGVLQSTTAPAANLLATIANLNVQAGGVKIDPNGVSVNLGQGLTTDPALGGAIDGGLTIVGTGGTVVMTNPGTYTGDTVIQSATLQAGPTVSGRPVAWYNFMSAGTAATTITNLGYGGPSMNGLLLSGAKIVSSTNHLGAGLSLSLTGGLGGGYVDLQSNVLAMNGNGNWTLAGWIQTSTSGSTILHKGNGNNWNAGFVTFYLTTAANGGQTTGHFMGAVQNSGGWVVGNTAVDNGQWHFVVIADNGGTKTIYTDGVLNTNGQNAYNNADTGTHAYIGKSTPTSGSLTTQNDGQVPFNGLMDSIYIYSYGLTAAEVSTLQTTGSYARVATAGTGQMETTTPVKIAAAGTLDLGGNNQTIGSLSDLVAGQGGSVTNSGDQVTAVLTVSPTAGVSTTFSGVIGDGLGKIGFAVNGAGTQVLTGTNTYTGGTTVASGTLIVTTPFGIEDGTNLTVGSPTLFGDPPLPAAPIPSSAVAAAPAASSALAPVPEPGTLALAAAGAVAALAMARRRRSSRRRAG